MLLAKSYGGDTVDKVSNASEENGGDAKIKHQSVLQSKLTRLAIQIGYAGRNPANVPVQNSCAIFVVYMSSLLSSSFIFIFASILYII